MNRNDAPMIIYVVFKDGEIIETTEHEADAYKELENKNADRCVTYKRA